MEFEKKVEYGADERRNKIVELLNKKGKIKVNDLSKMFEISEVSIRNDLAKLEDAGLLERVHGGAVSIYRTYYKMSPSERMQTNAEEKRRIAAEVGNMISENSTLMIGSGTTSLYVLEELRRIGNITIVTNGIYLSQRFDNTKNSNIILLGGIVDPKDQLTYGDDVIYQLNRYKADTFILSVDGVNCNDGITTYHYLDAEINRQMIARAKKTIVVADYTKIGRTSFALISPLEDIDVLVTNKNANENEIQEIRERGIEIKLV